jgi:hypothetical protein
MTMVFHWPVDGIIKMAETIDEVPVVVPMQYNA